jgi:hypothetical protein
MHCQKKFQEAAAAGALLIAQVKDNQPTLLQHAQQVCQTTIAVDQTRPGTPSRDRVTKPVWSRCSILTRP